VTGLSLKYNQQDATFSIYFYKLLYMFQAVSPPIIRSTKLYIQLQALSTNTAAIVDDLELHGVPDHPR
jgi:hypothetical protein